MTARADVGVAALDALVLLAGMALLYGIGLVRSPREAVRHAGVALFAGWAALGVAESWALVLGAPIRWWVTTPIAFVLAAGGVALGSRVAHRPLRLVGEHGLYRWVALAGTAIVAVDLGAVLARAAVQGAPLQWDAWAFWLPKARAIADFGGLDTHIGGFTSFVNPGYPPLAPALDATVFAFTGSTAAAPLAVQAWVIAAAFFAALWSLLSVRVRSAVFWPCLALLASLPNVIALIGSSLGEEPLMFLLGAGSACAALWLLEREPGYAALAALFLGAAALTKNEGMPPALTLGLVLLAVRQRRAPSLVLLAPLIAYAPWRIWISAHGLPPSSDYRLTDMLHPELLAHRLHRLTYAAHLLPGPPVRPRGVAHRPAVAARGGRRGCSAASPSLAASAGRGRLGGGRAPGRLLDWAAAGPLVGADVGRPGHRSCDGDGDCASPVALARSVDSTYAATRSGATWSSKYRAAALLSSRCSSGPARSRSISERHPVVLVLLSCLGVVGARDPAVGDVDARLERYGPARRRERVEDDAGAHREQVERAPRVAEVLTRTKRDEPGPGEALPELARDEGLPRHRHPGCSKTRFVPLEHAQRVFPSAPNVRDVRDVDGLGLVAERAQVGDVPPVEEAVAVDDRHDLRVV